MKKDFIIASAAILMAVLISSCNSNTKKDPSMKEETKKETAKKESKKDCSDVHWSHHKGEHGPENWANLCEGFKACDGKSQSPIDIKNVVKGDDLAPIDLKYGESKVNIINNGHTVQFNIEPGSSAMINGKKYDLLQFHYHAKSEHTIEGAYSPIEVHFVHKHADDDFAVIGVMYEEGIANELFANYLDKFPKEKGEYSSDEKIELSSLLPKNLSYYHYSGSLTTPPCSEVVSWYLLQKPLTASGNQIESFSEILNNNFRPLQALNGRTIYSFTE